MWPVGEGTHHLFKAKNNMASNTVQHLTLKELKV